MKSDVFNSLRRKLTLSFMLVLAFVLAILIGSLNLYLYISNYHESVVFMDSILNDKNISLVKLGHSRKGPVFDNVGALDPTFRFKDLECPKKSGPTLRYRKIIESALPFSAFSGGFRNYYLVELDDSNSIVRTLKNFSNAYTDDYKKALVKKILSLDETTGVYLSYGYSYKKTDDGYLLVILDRELEMRQQHRFAIVSVFMFIVSFTVIFIVSLILSRWAIRPVELAFDQQKRFIADASHELKTPIAVIDANVEVLLQDDPENKWLGYIKTENERMSRLVLDMLTLAKTDAGRMNVEMLPFDLAKAVTLSVLPFESIAFEQEKFLVLAGIPDEPVIVNGDESKIKQVVIILVDNAIKNSEKGALIRIRLERDNNKCHVRVYNTGHGIEPEFKDKIFNRFYRIDSSRDRNTGGYGLGLSIAQTIANAHHGKITVESEVEKYAEFVLTLPYDGKEKRSR